jgi:hypothetical protein
LIPDFTVDRRNRRINLRKKTEAEKIDTIGTTTTTAIDE